MKSMQQKLLRLIFISLVALVVAGESSAQSLLSESDINPCKELLAKGLAIDIERARSAIQDYGPGGKGRRNHAESVSDGRLVGAQRDLEKLSGLSILQFALQSPPYSPLYNLKDTQFFIKSAKENIAALQSGSEDRMSRVIGVPYRGQDLENRLAGDTKFLCMLNLRLTQLKGKSGSK